MVGGPWLEQIKVTKASTFQRSGAQETARATVEKKPSHSALVFIFRSFFVPIVVLPFSNEKKIQELLSNTCGLF